MLAHLKMQPSRSLSARRDGTMAALLSTIVIMFLTCHSTKIIVNFYEAIQVKVSHRVGITIFCQINFPRKCPPNKVSSVCFGFLLYAWDGPARRAGASNLGDDARQSQPSPLDHQLCNQHTSLLIQGKTIEPKYKHFYNRSTELSTKIRNDLNYVLAVHSWHFRYQVWRGVHSQNIQTFNLMLFQDFKFRSIVLSAFQNSRQSLQLSMKSSFSNRHRSR